MLGQDRLRVKLHAEDRVFPVAEGHNLPPRGEGRNFQGGGERFADNERVVAGSFKGAGDADEKTVPVVMNL